ncbi:MAG: hypothetical protein AB1696_28425 [Planctomycetota bacterium]
MKHAEAKKWLGVAPLFDPKKGKTVIEPLGKGEGYWAGAPSAMYDDETKKFYLYYRLRKPRPVRGGIVEIAESRDGVKFKKVWRCTREQLNSQSIEKTAIIKTPQGRFRAYISYVDSADARWRIDMMEADSPAKLDPKKRVKILTAADIGVEAVKDPAVYLIGGIYTMILSIAVIPKKLTAAQKNKMHSTADVHTTGITLSATGLALSTDGVNFEYLGEVFSPSKDGWDKYCARINSVLYLPPLYTAFYDGIPSEKENYEEKTGLAVSTDLTDFVRLTTDGPILTSPHASGALRYIDAFVLKDSIYYYYEYARKDGSHEVRLNKVALR